MAKKRGNNEGSIVQRKDGRWMASMTIGRDPETGKLKRAYFYGKTRQEAAEQLAKALRDKGQGVFVAPHKLIVGEWLDTWLHEYKKPRLRPITYDTYVMIVRRHIRPALGHVLLRDLRPEHVQRYYNEKAQGGLDPRTIKLHHVILSNALTLAEKHQLVLRNVCRLVEPPRQTRKEMQTLTLEQITTQLVPAIENDRFYAPIYLAFTTGLRRGELLGLRWRDIDLDAGVLHVRQTLSRVKNHETGKTYLTFQEPKTPQSRRSVPLTEASVVALKRHRGRQAQEKLLLGPAYEDQGLAFCREDGQPIDPRNFNYHFTNVLQRAGLPHIRLHDARHTFATLLLEQGVAAKVAQTILGHGSIAITLDTYSHVSSELEKQAAAKLNAALTGGLL